MHFYHFVVVDCGTPSDVSGASFTPAAPNTLYQSKFTVNCKSGYTQEGNTSHINGNNVVECGSDGRWMFGTILCQGMFRAVKVMYNNLKCGHVQHMAGFETR